MKRTLSNSHTSAVSKKKPSTSMASMKKPSTSVVPPKKRSTSTTSEKKPMFREIKPSPIHNTVGFKNNSIPPHHFHLGGENFVVVSDFGNNVNVHIQKFRTTERGNILPTKMLVSFSPFIWESLSNNLERLSLLSDPREVAIIRDALFLARVIVENQSFISLQKYVIKKDASRQFLPSMVMLSEREWYQLHSIRKKVTESCKSLLFSSLMKQKILALVQTRSPQPPLDMKQDDIIMILSTSLTEILSKHLSDRIQDVFVCLGCQNNQFNQLGHDCITMSNKTKNSLYGQLALMSIDLEILAIDFIDQNIQMLNYINDAFFHNINIELLVENSAKMYISTDTLHYRMF